jgi:anti-sigma B factor antagonist
LQGAQRAGGERELHPVIVAPFDIEIRLADGIRRVSVLGELDLANAPQLAARLGELGTRQSAPIEVDLAGVSFIDARGLRVLIEAHASGNGAGGPGLSLVRPSRAARRLFELTGTLGLLQGD